MESSIAGINDFSGLASAKHGRSWNAEGIRRQTGKGMTTRDFNYNLLGFAAHNKKPELELTPSVD